MSEIVVTANPKAPNEISFEQRERDLNELERKRLKEIKKSPFTNFYQVNKDSSNYLRSCLKENPRALELLLFIFDHMDKYNAVVCSYKVFQEALGVGQATIARAIKYLKDNGFLYVYKSGSSNVYVANNDLVWNSWGTNIEYCEFPANIVLSKSEQEEQIKVRNKRIQTVQIKEKKNKFERHCRPLEQKRGIGKTPIPFLTVFLHTQLFFSMWQPFRFAHVCTHVQIYVFVFVDVVLLQF